jgi:hypothetical protein
MWKVSASILCGCLAALPLIGCAGDIATGRQAATPPPHAASSFSGGPRVYAVGPAAPSAILVFLPGIGGVSSEDFVPEDPALWAAQGFDVLTPQPADFYRLAADQQAAVARLLASARALADAPIWLVGPSPIIEAALATAPQAGRGRVSGAVVTSVTSNAGSCSASFSYYDPGTGAPPKIEVKKSGDCGALAPSGSGSQPLVVPQPPAARPGGPRIIEASAAPKNLPPAAQVRHLAELIRTSPAS